MKTIKIISKRKISIIAIVFIVVFLLFFFAIYVGKTIVDSKKDINYHSDMLALKATITEELQEYYKKNDRYPESLLIIKENVLKRYYPYKIPEDPNIMDFFGEFKYSNDGNSYSMFVEVEHGGVIYTHKEKGQKGELPQTELYTRKLKL